MTGILIVSPTGYVGKRLASTARGLGLSVYGLSRSPLSPKEWPEGASHLESDTGSAAFRRFLTEKVDAIIYLSADTRKVVPDHDVCQMVAVNAARPARLATIAAECGVRRLAFASTYSVSINDQPYAPQSLYAATKKAAEDLLQYVGESSLLAVSVLRLYDIYGPSQPHERLIPYLLKQLRSSRTIELSGGDQPFCPVYVDDVVAALLHACRSEHESTSFDLSTVYGPDVMAVKEVPLRIAEALGMPEPVVQITRPPRDREAMTFNPSAPPLRGWRPETSFSTGVRNAWNALLGSSGHS